MKRDTRIVRAVLMPVPVVFLIASAVCSFAISRGATIRWRLAFRMMCHGIPSRCLVLFGVPMPICARCVGIYLGLFAGLALFALIPMLSERMLKVVSIAAVMPLVIDGLTQLIRLRESTNGMRIATGFVAAFAFGLWVLAAIERRDHTPMTSP